MSEPQAARKSASNLIMECLFSMTMPFVQPTEYDQLMINQTNKQFSYTQRTITHSAKDD